MASSSSKKINVKCSKGDMLEMEEALVNDSPTMKLLMEESDNNVITLPDISSQTMHKVIEYMKKHAADPHADCKNWDAEFVKVDLELLFSTIVAAHHLKIATLVDLGCQAVADKIKGKSTEEIRKTLNLKNDFTLEEEEQIRWLSRYFFGKT